MLPAQPERFVHVLLELIQHLGTASQHCHFLLQTPVHIVLHQVLVQTARALRGTLAVDVQRLREVVQRLLELIGLLGEALLLFSAFAECLVDFAFPVNQSVDSEFCVAKKLGLDRDFKGLTVAVLKNNVNLKKYDPASSRHSRMVFFLKSGIFKKKSKFTLYDIFIK